MRSALARREEGIVNCERSEVLLAEDKAVVIAAAWRERERNLIYCVVCSLSPHGSES